MVPIAHSARHQEMFDHIGLAWAVQWEVCRSNFMIYHLSISCHYQIARIVATHPGLSWDDVPLDLLAQLCGSASENAPLVASVLFGQHPRFNSINSQEKAVRPPAYACPW